MALTVNSGTSLTTLFSSLSTSSTTSNIYSNLSDYSSIKSGSYGKLLTKYYENTSDDDTSSIATSKSSTLALSSTESNAEDLQSAANTLASTGSDSVFNKTNDEYDTDKIYSAVKNFVSSYNSTLTSAGNVDSSSIDSAVSSMKSATSSYSRSLAKIGITTGTNGKLSIDEDTFKKADMDSVKSLFNTTGSYGTQVEQQAYTIDYAAKYESAMANTYTSSGSYSSTYNSGSILSYSL